MSQSTTTSSERFEREIACLSVNRACRRNSLSRYSVFVSSIPRGSITAMRESIPPKERATFNSDVHDINELRYLGEDPSTTCSSTFSLRVRGSFRFVASGLITQDEGHSSGRRTLNRVLKCLDRGNIIHWRLRYATVLKGKGVASSSKSALPLFSNSVVGNISDFQENSVGAIFMPRGCTEPFRRIFFRTDMLKARERADCVQSTGLREAANRP